MNRREFLATWGGIAGASLSGLPTMLHRSRAAEAETKGPVPPSHSEWPTAWITYRPVESLEADVADLKKHGVGLISQTANSTEQARDLLHFARQHEIKYCITNLQDITEHRPLVEQAGLEPAAARMIGGVYKGLAIDRHLFSFSAQQHELIIEPPVYNQELAYKGKNGERIAHYFPDMGDPIKAEVVVPLKRFDGQQHLKILPATIERAPTDAEPENDSVSDDLPKVSELTERKLYRMRFDLSGLDDAMLDHVGLAVYWEYGGTDKYWIFGQGNVTAWADSTRKALRQHVSGVLEPWIEANDGSFPNDVVLAARYGDECFYITSHLNGPSVSYPLWDYSQPAIDQFKRWAGDVEPPRAWGYPEIYGPDAYAWWLYTLHKGCADICGIVREVFDEKAPNLLAMRNTTRMGALDLHNDHDGSGQELLAQQLDIVHLDPYPLHGDGYSDVIPRDMSYCSGLARRYDKPLVPWLQAHTYGGPDGLQHVKPQHVKRMCEQHRRHGVDAIMWLGYGSEFTFPNKRPESWEQAGKCHEHLQQFTSEKAEAKLAVLRSYRTWSLHSAWDGQIRNPADWLLQQLLEVWAVKYKQPYDVFELPPSLNEKQKAEYQAQLKRYAWLVSTEPWEDAWVVGEHTNTTTIDPDEASEYQQQFEQQLKARGWL